MSKPHNHTNKYGFNAYTDQGVEDCLGCAYWAGNVDGVTEGFDDGYSQGYDHGYSAGYRDGGDDPRSWE